MKHNLLLVALLIIPLASAGTIYDIGNFETEFSKEFTGYVGDALEFKYAGESHIIKIHDVNDQGQAYLKILPNKGLNGTSTGSTIDFERNFLVDFNQDGTKDFKIELSYVDDENDIASLILDRIDTDVIASPGVKNPNELTGNVVQEDSKANIAVGTIIMLVIIIIGLLIFLGVRKR